MGAIDAIDAFLEAVFGWRRSERAWKSVWWRVFCNVLIAAYAICMRSAPPAMPDMTFQEYVELLARALVERGASLGLCSPAAVMQRAHATSPPRRPACVASPPPWCGEQPSRRCGTKVSYRPLPLRQRRRRRQTRRRALAVAAVAAACRRDR